MMWSTLCLFAMALARPQAAAGLRRATGLSGVTAPVEPTEVPRSQQEAFIDHAAVARYLVHNSDYGVAATHSSLEPGTPFANVMSVSDGPSGHSTGRIIFYVATVSVFAADVKRDSRASFAVSQEQTPKGCMLEDPEWPLCSRATVVGHALALGPKEAPKAAELMFARHPQMRLWAHLAHKWLFYELKVSHVEVLDFFGGFQNVSRADYFAASPDAHAAVLDAARARLRAV